MGGNGVSSRSYENRGTNGGQRWLFAYDQVSRPFATVKLLVEAQWGPVVSKLPTVQQSPFGVSVFDAGRPSRSRGELDSVSYHSIRGMIIRHHMLVLCTTRLHIQGDRIVAVKEMPVPWAEQWPLRFKPKKIAKAPRQK
jgi:hypothetical protein